MKKIVADIDEILHEWHTPKAECILKEMGVSERNWRLFALNGGYADGKKWSFWELSEMEGNISHVRAATALQIAKMLLRRPSTN